MRLRPIFAVLGVLGVLSPMVALSSPGDGGQSSSNAGTCKGTLPEDYNGFLVFMANGAVPVAEGFFLDGAIFQEEILGRSPDEIAEDRQNALDYFESRFGIVAADTNPDVLFLGFYADPRINYRAYVISGERVPPEGYEVHDGGWVAIVTNPAGIDLGGAYTGTHVPYYSFFSYGDYSIEVTRPGKGPKPPPIVIHYQCNDPLVPLPNGGEVFTCDITSDRFGAGRAEGMTSPVFEGGFLRPNGRTVLTFSDRGGE